MDASLCSNRKFVMPVFAEIQASFKSKQENNQASVHISGEQDFS
jgi:hypothetical protein